MTMESIIATTAGLQNGCVLLILREKSKIIVNYRVEIVVSNTYDIYINPINPDFIDQVNWPLYALVMYFRDTGM